MGVAEWGNSLAFPGHVTAQAARLQGPDGLPRPGLFLPPCIWACSFSAELVWQWSSADAVPAISAPGGLGSPFCPDLGVSLPGGGGGGAGGVSGGHETTWPFLR